MRKLPVDIMRLCKALPNGPLGLVTCPCCNEGVEKLVPVRMVYSNTTAMVCVGCVEMMHGDDEYMLFTAVEKLRFHWKG